MFLPQGLCTCGSLSLGTRPGFSLLILWPVTLSETSQAIDGGCDFRAPGRQDDLISRLWGPPATAPLIPKVSGVKQEPGLGRSGGRGWWAVSRPLTPDPGLSMDGLTHRILDKVQLDGPSSLLEAWEAPWGALREGEQSVRCLGSPEAFRLAWSALTTLPGAAPRCQELAVPV